MRCHPPPYFNFFSPPASCNTDQIRADTHFSSQLKEGGSERVLDLGSSSATTIMVGQQRVSTSTITSSNTSKRRTNRPSGHHSAGSLSNSHVYVYYLVLSQAKFDHQQNQQLGSSPSASSASLAVALLRLRLPTLQKVQRTARMSVRSEESIKRQLRNCHRITTTAPATSTVFESLSATFSSPSATSGFSSSAINVNCFS